MFIRTGSCETDLFKSEESKQSRLVYNLYSKLKLDFFSSELRQPKTADYGLQIKGRKVPFTIQTNHTTIIEAWRPYTMLSWLCIWKKRYNSIRSLRLKSLQILWHAGIALLKWTFPSVQKPQQDKSIRKEDLEEFNSRELMEKCLFHFQGMVNTSMGWAVQRLVSVWAFVLATPPSDDVINLRPLLPSSAKDILAWLTTWPCG